MARYQCVSRNNLPWFQNFIFPCPTPSLPPSLLLLVARCKKGNRFTSATRYRKISQDLTNRQFLKMKNNLNKTSSHLCTNNLLNNYSCVAVAKLSFANSQSHPKKCEFKYELKILGFRWWHLVSDFFQFTWPSIFILKMKGETHTEVFFHEMYCKE